jgi:anti-sigma regulatory factor (Ser/Thr protein kinase)
MTLAECYPAVAESVPAARRSLVDFAMRSGAGEEQAEALRLAASEALTNAVIHGYRDGPGEIHVSAWVVAGELWMLIADDGCGVRAGSDRPGLGLGLGLIAHLSDGLVILDRATGGTEVRVRFQLDEDASAEDDQRRGSVASARRPASSRFSTTA